MGEKSWLPCVLGYKMTTKCISLAQSLMSHYTNCSTFIKQKDNAFHCFSMNKQLHFTLVLGLRDDCCIAYGFKTHSASHSVTPVPPVHSICMNRALLWCSFSHPHLLPRSLPNSLAYEGTLGYMFKSKDLELGFKGKNGYVALDSLGWVTALSIIFSTSIPLPAEFMISFFSLVSMHHTFIAHLSVKRRSGWPIS